MQILIDANINVKCNHYDCALSELLVHILKMMELQQYKVSKNVASKHQFETHECFVKIEFIK